MIMYKRINMTTTCKLNLNSMYNCKRYMLTTSEVALTYITKFTKPLQGER